MSRGNGEPPHDGDDDDEEGGGYCRPPKRTRFKPGQSGNPKGRPKGARSKHKQLLAHLEPTRDIILEEAYAPLQLRNGERTVEVAAIRAVTKATIKSAVNGGQMAQRTMLDLTQRNEAAVAEVGRKLFDRLYKHKQNCERERRRCRAAGEPEPDFLPHPDDIFIDWDTLTAEVRGPLTPEQREALEKLLDERDKYERGFAGHRANAKARPRDWTLLIWASRAQEVFDYINDRLPQRCRKRLVDRMLPDEIEAAEERGRRALARKRKPRRG